MRILYIHQYFATLDSGTGTRSYEFARRFVQSGHDVTVLTGPTHLSAVLPPRAGWVHRFECDGIHVVVANVPYHQTMGYLRRVLSFLLFALLTTWLALWLPRPDVTLASSTPLTVAIPALALKWLRRVPYVFEVRDVWPAVPVGIGVLRNRFAIALLQWLEHRAYLGAAHIVPLSPGMESVVRASIGDRRPCTVIPNAADVSLFKDADGVAFRAAHGWAEKCVLLHAGAMGRVNGLNAVVRAADALRDRPTALFVLAGEGRERAALEQLAAERNLTNVEFLDKLPKRDMPALFAAADICLMVVAPYPVLEHNCANKFFDALAAGKPQVMNYGGWKRETLEDDRAGIGCAMGDDDAFAAAIATLIDDADLRRQMGDNASTLAVECFDRNKLASDMELVLVQTAR